MDKCKHNWVFFYPVCICSECDVKRDTDTLFAQQKARIKALEGVVECAKRWSETEARWQAHLTHCDKCQNQVMCSEEWIDISFAVIQAWKDTWTALKKLEEVQDEC